jgi:hypothetical protein
MWAYSIGLVHLHVVLLHRWISKGSIWHCTFSRVLPLLILITLPHSMLFKEKNGAKAAKYSLHKKRKKKAELEHSLIKN